MKALNLKTFFITLISLLGACLRIACSSSDMETTEDDTNNTVPTTTNLPQIINVPLPPETNTIWVDADSASNGNGTQSSPFNSLRSAESWAMNNPATRPLYIRCRGHETLSAYLYFYANGAGPRGEIVITSWDDTETYTLQLGTSNDPEQFRLMGSYLILDGRDMVNPKFRIHAMYRGLRIGDSDYTTEYITVWRIEVYGAGYYGIGTDGGAHFNIFNNNLHDNFNGMYPNSGHDVAVSNNLIYNNELYGIHHNCHYDLPRVAEAYRWVYNGNLLVNNVRGGCFYSGGSQVDDCGHLDDVVVKNNIIMDHTEWGWRISDTEYPCNIMENIRVYNNTFYNNYQALYNSHRDGISPPNPAMLGIARNNLFIGNTFDMVYRQGSGWEDESDNMNGDAEAIVTDINDSLFMRLPANSALIDAGYDLAAENVRTGYFGVSRPQGSGYDIGAHECP